MLRHGSAETVGWFSLGGPLSDAEVERYLDAFMDLCRLPSSSLTYAVVIVGADAFPNAKQRRIIARSIDENRALLADVGAISNVTPNAGALVRGTLRAISWLTRKHWPENVHPSVSDAARWLESEGAPFAAIAEVEREVSHVLGA